MSSHIFEYKCYIHSIINSSHPSPSFPLNLYIYIYIYKKRSNEAHANIKGHVDPNVFRISI